MSTLGFLGIGRMGQAMAPRLIEAGFKLVIWNRSVEATRELQQAGALVASHPSEIWEHADIAITMLRDSAAMMSVLEGPKGLLSGVCDQKLICDMATHSPADSVRIGKLVEDSGARYVDAPVGGTVEPARTGNLVVFTGGRPEDIKRLRSVLEPLSRQIFDMGRQGNGATMKIIMNLVLTVYWEAVAEGLSVAKGSGLDPALVLDVLEQTPAALPVLPGKRDLLLDISDDVGFDINGVRKDMQAVMRTLAELGISAPAAASTHDAVSDAASFMDYGTKDVAKLASYRQKLITEPDGTGNG